jgi:hypothetical protein
MRRARIKHNDEPTVYHCISRTVGGLFLFQEPDKERFNKMMRQQAQFCGVQIITHNVMSNHFHIGARLDVKKPLSDEELLRRVKILYGTKRKEFKLLVEGIEQTGKIPDNLRNALERRMGDLSNFMKELKQRFSRWYNKDHGRYGTLWAERFRSEIVQDGPQGARQMAAYIDLNSVRAGLNDDPAKYRFCGYAEAMAGGKLAREGISSVHEQKEWREVAREYRKLLFVTAGVSGSTEKVALTPAQIQRELERGGELTLAQVLRIRLRHFSDGVVLGSPEYVEKIYGKFRKHFGANRKTGARSMRIAALKGLCTLRDLRVAPFGHPKKS